MSYATTARIRRRAPLAALVLAALLLAGAPAQAGEASDWFSRGDANRDGSLNIADAITTLDFLFGGGVVTLLCEDAADANDDGSLNIADAISILNYLFVAPVPLPAPFGVPGGDPTADPLDCAPIDCLTPVEVEGALGLGVGTYPLPGVVPAQTITESGVTITTSTADGTLTVSTIVYDPVLDTVTATGTAGAIDVPVTVVWTIFTFNCIVDFEVDWMMTGAFATAPYNAESTQLVSVQPGSIALSTSNPTANISGCALSTIASLVNGILVGAVQDAIDAQAPFIAAGLAAQVDAALLATPVIVCD